MTFDSKQFNSETVAKTKELISKGWLTRHYLAQGGKHNLVLPGWLLEILGEHGESRHGISGAPILKNTDHRSFFSIGSPDSEEEPIVDHRGGIIPIPNSYMLLFGTLVDDFPYYSSEKGIVNIELTDEGYPIVTVYWEIDGDTMVYDVYSDRDDEGNEAIGINVVRGFANHPLFITLTPLDQDGVSFISYLEYDHRSLILKPKDLPQIRLSEPPIRYVTLPLNMGHAGRRIHISEVNSEIAECQAGLPSWAASFAVRSSPTFIIPLNGDPDNFPDFFPDPDDIEEKWEDLIDNLPKINTSDELVNQLFVNSAIVLRLLADIDKSVVTMGPTLQEEVWLPSLVFQTKALDRLGFSENCVRPILDKLSHDVDNNGIIAKGRQWDSQGAYVKAITNHYMYTKDVHWLGEKFSGIKRIGDWVVRQYKKTEDESTSNNIKGLLPKGNLSWFNPIYWNLDYYYIHNFWAISVLTDTIELSKSLGRHGEVEKYSNDYEKFKQAVDDSITQTVANYDFLPSGPNQMDSAEMFFNLQAFYPLKLYLPAFQPLINTMNWLEKNYCQDGVILIDYPWNAFGTYISILFAQAIRFATPNNSDKILKIIDFLKMNRTNQQGWAEGISPLSNKGSAGDSPNGYTAAEWINLILDLFVEEDFEKIVLLKGIPIKWLNSGISCENIKLYGGGKIDIESKITKNDLFLKWETENEDNNKDIILYLPKQTSDTIPGAEKISTYEVKLNSPSGKITISLND